MSNKYVGAAKFFGEKVVKPAVTAIKKTFSKKSPTITKTKPKVGSLTIRRKDQDDVIESTQKVIDKKNLTTQGKIAVRKTIAPAMRDISKTRDQIVALEKKLSDKGKEKLKKIREKKMGGGMMGRRMGYSEGSNGKKFGAGDGVITPYEKRRGQAIKAAIKARKGKRMQAANGTDLSPSFEAIKKFMKTQRTRGNTQPPKEPMRDRMRDKMKQPLKKQPLKRKKP